MWFLIVLGLVVLLFGLFWAFRCLAGRMLLRKIKKDSLILFGKKGHGKTLLMSEMSRMDRRTGYVSTTDFKHKRQEPLIVYSQVNVGENTWENVIEGKFFPCEQMPWEGKPIYLDDAGIFLPNFVDTTLKKKYPSLPVAYAVWRHLYNAPIHINSQNVERTWKLIREQADGYILARGVIRLGAFAIVKSTYYDRIESAKKELSPMKSTLFNKYNKAELNLFEANNGIVKDFYIFAPSWRNRYDSRYFKRKFFPSEKDEKKTPNAPELA